MDARTPSPSEVVAAPVAKRRPGRFTLTPINLRRWQNFKANRRGYWSLWIFLVLFVGSLGAEFIANDKPFFVSFEGRFYFPAVIDYPETTFGGDFETAADYRDPYLQKLIADKGGYMLWPPIRYSYNTHNLDLPTPAPSPPTWMLTEAQCKDVVERKHLNGCSDLEYNWLGTDDQGRDVVARLIYGFRISVLFGLILTIVSSVIGVAAGAVQGYFGGWTDLLFQRFIEIWTSLPELYLLLIISSVLVPGFFTLLGILLLFSWVSLVGLVRAEFLRGRNFEYIQAARALGVSNRVIMFRHLLPNAMVATMTMLPFILSGSVMELTALDFLGFGLPPGSPSLGEMLQQGKSNIQAPWLGISGFFTIAIMMSLLIFIGEAVRDAFDPRKTLQVSAMDASASPLLSVRDLSVSFGHGDREMLAVDRVSFDIRKGETLALVGESGSGKSATALSIMKLLPYPSAAHPSGAIMFKGQDLMRLSDREIRRHRGGDITIVFQEPMTSLNPLHTIEKQLGEILLLHGGVTGKAARTRILELLDPVRDSRSGKPAAELSAPALGRPAPARDDRDGARQRAGPLDRGRADDRARRHRAGADSPAPQGPAVAPRHGDPVHHPRPRHRPQDRGTGLRDEAGQDRRAGIGRAGVHGAAASLHPRSPGRRAQGPAGTAQSAGRGHRPHRRSQGLVPDQARRAAQGGRPHQGGGRREHRGAARRDAGHRRRIRLRKDDAGARDPAVDLLQRPHRVSRP